MLGILTAIGGFVDVGNIATAGEAGSKFGYSLVWAVLLGTVVVIFLIEMVGRMAAMGDKAYSSAANRAYLRRRGIQAVIPVKDDQKGHRRARGRRGGRPPAFDPQRYKERNTVERCFSKLKQFRAVATRFDKRKLIYQGTVDQPCNDEEAS